MAVNKKRAFSIFFERIFEDFKNEHKNGVFFVFE